jgi:hypothetical protein
MNNRLDTRLVLEKREIPISHPGVSVFSHIVKEQDLYISSKGKGKGKYVPVL